MMMMMMAMVGFILFVVCLRTGLPTDGTFWSPREKIKGLLRIAPKERGIKGRFDGPDGWRSQNVGRYKDLRFAGNKSSKSENDRSYNSMMGAYDAYKLQQPGNNIISSDN